MPVAISTARLEARIFTNLHAMLERAAELQGRTMTNSVVSAVQAAAHQAIEQAEVIRLSRADQACFAQLLLSPPKPARLWSALSVAAASSCAQNEQCAIPAGNAVCSA